MTFQSACFNLQRRVRVFLIRRLKGGVKTNWINFILKVSEHQSLCLFLFSPQTSYSLFF